MGPSPECIIVSLGPPLHGSHELPLWPAVDDEEFCAAREHIRFPARPPDKNILSCL